MRSPVCGCNALADILRPLHPTERNQKLAECQLPTSVKQDKGGRESAAAYHALNIQLIDELPAFIRGIEAFVSILLD